MSRFNQILIALFAAQIVGLVATRASTQDPAAQRTVSFFTGLDTDKVTSIEIEGTPPSAKDDPPQNKVTIAKKDGQWGVANADDFPIEKAKVDELLETLKKLRSRNRVLDSSTYHEKLEVSADKYQRKLTVATGDQKTVLYVGSSPRFKNVHVRLDGDDAVYLVNDFGPNELGDRAWSWVNREYIKVPGEQVWQIRVKNAKGEVQLDKDPVSNEWAVLGVNKELDTSSVNDFVRKASNVNLETPVGKSVATSQGFDKPAATITLVTGTSTIAGTPPPQTETVTWQIGQKIESANQYFVKASDNPYVVKVAGWGVEPLVEKATPDFAKKEEPEKK